MATSNRSPGSITSNRVSSLTKLMAWLIIAISMTYVVYSLNLLLNSRSCLPVHSSNSVKSSIMASDSSNSSQIRKNNHPPEKAPENHKTTSLSHIMFGIAASASLWEQRKEYIKLWWRPSEMRGVVWLDRTVKIKRGEGLPTVKISGNTSGFAYKNRQGHRSAIRISRIVSETLRLDGIEGVHWFVMGDDDTVFVVDNLVRILSKYDHNQFYYIGSLSESHLQNIYFSYGMAYGGGGFAISYPLAKALSKMQDRCIQRYPGLYGSDDRMQACMAELGVPLTKEPGFHQYDVYGNLFGLLAAHPVTPLVSLHHLDVVEPIFPNVTRVEALRRLHGPMKADSAGLMQQSICYDRTREWSFSVSWGYAVQIFRGVFSPRELEMPSRTFLNWYRRADYTAYAFNTRPVSRHPCQKPFVFYFDSLRYTTTHDTQAITVTRYSRHRVPAPECRWRMVSPAKIEWIEVRKKPDPLLWNKSPRRNCCRVMTEKEVGAKGVSIEVGECRDGEISEL
ncbi:hypothetical protein AMTR_s00001p00252920 [Amborella trichopoda]|uniref:Uncharacterized protein n=2 Tax=Amborella trichopoda TaxID=13333 RepID=W1NMD6_AMBTC|nr:hypothetical protein AMTR_s00001p00252920 [Amborella trichopoda]